MTTVELLQQIGLNKYEAEAYYALLTHEALTGYELGKRSQVPLSRSYEILERLTEKGLALVQPGEPPRYTARDPQHFLAHVRSDMESTLGALSSSFATLVRPDVAGEFWVVRGRQHILARARQMIASTQTTLTLTLPPDGNDELADVLAQAWQRGCHIVQHVPTDQRLLGAHCILLLRDNAEALLGMLAPTTCQAIVSAHPALLATLHGYFAQQQLSNPAATIPQPAQPERTDWLGWEIRKQRHLWSLSAPGHGAA